MFAFELNFLKWLEGLRTGFFNAIFEGITFVYTFIAGLNLKKEFAP